MSRYALLVALLVMLWATETMATTIGFGNLGGSNLSTFTSYTESGYIVEATKGQWFEAHVFGSNVPAIFAGPIYNPVESQISVTYEHGGQFTFQGVDLTSNVAGGTTYTIAGFLGTSGVFSESVHIDSVNHFETRLFSSLGLVDHLTITGKPGEHVTSFNIDNIRAGKYTDSGHCPGYTCPVNAPEPASLLLLGAGLAGIEIWRWRRGTG
jgi:PEP-CTERM motif